MTRQPPPDQQPDPFGQDASSGRDASSLRVGAESEAAEDGVAGNAPEPWLEELVRSARLDGETDGAPTDFARAVLDGLRADPTGERVDARGVVVSPPPIAGGFGRFGLGMLAASVLAALSFWGWQTIAHDPGLSEVALDVPSASEPVAASETPPEASVAGRPRREAELREGAPVPSVDLDRAGAKLAKVKRAFEQGAGNADELGSRDSKPGSSDDSNRAGGSDRTGRSRRMAKQRKRGVPSAETLRDQGSVLVVRSTGRVDQPRAESARGGKAGEGPATESKSGGIFADAEQGRSRSSTSNKRRSEPRASKRALPDSDKGAEAKSLELGAGGAKPGAQAPARRADGATSEPPKVASNAAKPAPTEQSQPVDGAKAAGKSPRKSGEDDFFMGGTPRPAAPSRRQQRPDEVELGLAIRRLLVPQPASRMRKAVDREDSAEPPAAGLAGQADVSVRKPIVLVLARAARVGRPLATGGRGSTRGRGAGPAGPASRGPLEAGPPKAVSPPVGPSSPGPAGPSTPGPSAPGAGSRPLGPSGGGGGGAAGPATGGPTGRGGPVIGSGGKVAGQPESARRARPAPDPRGADLRSADSKPNEPKKPSAKKAESKRPAANVDRDVWALSAPSLASLGLPTGPWAGRLRAKVVRVGPAVPGTRLLLLRGESADLMSFVAAVRRRAGETLRFESRGPSDRVLGRFLALREPGQRPGALARSDWQTADLVIVLPAESPSGK